MGKENDYEAPGFPHFPHFPQMRKTEGSGILRLKRYNGFYKFVKVKGICETVLSFNIDEP
jgi:hypothetical protein